MIPRRLCAWILVWTPLTWLVLTLLTYPVDTSLNDGAAAVLQGFVSPEVADYPGWILIVLGLLTSIVAAARVRRGTRNRAASYVLFALACLLLVWGLATFLVALSASGTNDGVAFGWLFQAVAVLLSATLIWALAVGNPERAAATCTRLSVNLRLFRSNREGLTGLLILCGFAGVALLAPFLADHDLLRATNPIGPPMSAPARWYPAWLGGDEQGLAVLVQVIWSARISLVVGIVAALVSTTVGTSVGVVSGFYGRWRGEVGMRLTDAFLVLPWLPLAMVLAAAWGQSYVMIMVIIGLISWPSTARVVRADTLRVRELQFIERARALGSSNTHMVLRHVLPNVFPLVFANTILVVGVAIVYETALSVLGLGDPLNFSWGTMLHNAWVHGAASVPAWWYLLPPGVCIIMVVVAFTLVGTALDEVLDPKLRGRDSPSVTSRASDADSTPATTTVATSISRPTSEVGGDQRA